MASFDSTDLNLDQTVTNLPRHPIKRFEPALRKFEVALPADLARLQQHKKNMETARHLSVAWFELNKEQINAARTVQQLKSHLKEMENIRKQVQVSDIPEFDQRIKPLQEEILAGVSSFREVQQMYAREKQDKEPKRMPFARYKDTSLPPVTTTEPDGNSQKLQTLVVVDKDAVVSWDSLRAGLIELNDLIHDFSTIVHEQQDTIDSIEGNIESAQVHVEEGTRALGKASKLKAVTYPLIGAAVGGVCGGPLGLAIGLKAGAAIALGGGVLGYFGGRYFKKKQEEATDIQLDNLSSSREVKKYR
ncbi:unnamed protein product [Pocillopora meandrina]|uniref:t-SNARE coiled-coil homology domain-containing protein n=1 Tax=Pocillopora meandrina TaxID=46732 RepID=A0AAU9X2P7_9CNID|nr:unnamed protein product [Pocillopora meandrina]